MRTAVSLPSEQARANRLVLEGLYFAILPDRSWPSFAAYVDDLAARAPETLRDRLLDELARRAAGGRLSPERRAALLARADAYLAFLREGFPGATLDVGVETEVHRLLNRPDALREVVVSHLRLMWSAHLAPEWERGLPLLRESVDALRQVALDGLSVTDAVRAITGHELLGERARILGNARRIIFVPSLHVGPYLDPFVHGEALWLIFGARLPDASWTDSSALTRSELLVRLTALTDDVRLRMLALLSGHGELCAQEIMVALDITQSAASRHLRQLSANGYLVERRREGNKCYSLNRARIRETARAIERFVDAGQLKPERL